MEMQNLHVFESANNRSAHVSDTGDKSWRRVQLDIDWLRKLAPAATSNNSAINSLSLILESMSLPNSTNLDLLTNSMGFASIEMFTEMLDATGWTRDLLKYGTYLPSEIEPVVAALVADGMSRVGLMAVNPEGPPTVNPLFMTPLGSDPALAAKKIMAGTYTFNNRAAGPSTKVNFTVTVSGLAYLADSNSYILALLVLLIHAAFALAHIAYVVRHRVFCTTWDSSLGFVVLAAKSGAKRAKDRLSNAANRPNSANSVSDTASLFRNAGSGIERYQSMKTEVRIRATDTLGTHWSTVGGGLKSGAGQQVEILFGGDEGKLAQAGYKKLKIGKVYG
ncbi:MAG: hypothetical protein Q9208_005354 [Pyrenodesmia sp. 3 TL-2023]